MLTELNAEIAARDITPLQKVQYTYQKKLISEGKVGTVGFTVVPVGNLASPAEPNSSYVSLVAVSMHPFSRGRVVCTLCFLAL